MNTPKPIIGLCGGVGAGKSTVAREFELLGCSVVDSDKINRQLLQQPDVIRTLVSWWGQDILNEDGSLNRRRIADLVFNDLEKKRRLESLLHPLILERHEGIIACGNNDPKVVAIVLDSPLLFESNLHRRCVAVVFVEASEAARLDRIAVTRQWDVDELRRRESCQTPLNEKRARSRFAILNEGSIEQARSQIVRVLRQIQTEYSPEQ